THMPLTLAAARAGKHVLCEKPMAMDVSECCRMIDACEEAGVKLMVAFMSRFHTPFRRLKEHIEAGVLGRVVACRCRWGFHYPPQPGLWRQDPALGGGGPLMDVGSHALDLLRFWLGEVDEVAALSDTLAFDYDVEDTCTVLLRFACGAQGVVESHFSVPGAENGTEILGTMGIARIPHVNTPEPIQIHTLDGDQIIPPDGPNRYTAMFEHFAEACLTAGAVEVTGEDGARNTELIRAAYRSAQERTFVSA
ncbi:Gfo/Idh/MocA family oxidoreductase, partial [PVC group bacterium]|nr:Gfo/Idh/MocA family oxidoreductase [PVC group bacterium]